MPTSTTHTNLEKNRTGGRIGQEWEREKRKQGRMREAEGEKKGHLLNIQGKRSNHSLEMKNKTTANIRLKLLSKFSIVML